MTNKRRSPFGSLLRSLRKERSLTQLDLATMTGQGNSDHPGLTEKTIWRIEQAVSPGTPWVKPHPATVHSLAHALDLEPGSPKHTAFLEAARATAEAHGLPEHWSTPESAGNPVSFIAAGREPQLDHVRRAFADAAAGTPGAIFVGAGPGTGKTTLIAHACREAAGVYPGLVVLWGECTGRSGAADPYQPLRQALGTMAGDVAAAGPRQLISPENASRIVQRLPIAIEALASEGMGLVDRVIPSRLLHSLQQGGTVDAAVSEQIATLLDNPAPAFDTGINEQILRVLLNYTRAGPVALVLEDLHWADGATASFLFHLARRLPGQRHPLLVIGSWRPSGLDADGPAPHDDSFAPTLRELPRFIPRSIVDLSTAVGGEAGQSFVDAMVRQTIGDPPDDLGEILFEQTAGLPLLVRGMLELYQSTGQTRLQPTGSGPIHLPADVEAMFANLLGQLPPDLRQHLAIASVQGVTFSANVTMKVLGTTHTALVDELETQLNRRFGMLEPGGETSVAGQRHYLYRFSHALVRDYIYYGMTTMEREYAHIATAEAMLDLYGEGEHEGAGEIARHFDLGGDHRRAAAAYNRAGLHALALRDFDLATAMFGRVRELGLEEKDPFLAAQALLGLGNSARGASNPSLATERFSQAFALARRKRLRLIEATARSCLGLVDYTAGRMTQAAAGLTQAVELLVEEGDRAEHCRTLTFLSHALHGMGWYDDAIAAAREAIAIATDLDDDLLIATSTIALAICLTDLGDYAGAGALYRETIANSERRGDTHRVNLAWYNVASGEIEQEHWDRAEAANRHVLDPSRRPTLGLLGGGEFNAGFIAEGQGRLDDAARHYERSLDYRTRNGQAALAMEAHGGLLRVAVARGDRDAVQTLLVRLRAWIDSHGVEGMEHPGRIFVTLAEAHHALDDPDRARETAREGLALVTARAGSIADPGQRRAFLYDIRTHRRLRALAEPPAHDDP